MKIKKTITIMIKKFVRVEILYVGVLMFIIALMCSSCKKEGEKEGAKEENTPPINQSVNLSSTGLTGQAGLDTQAPISAVFKDKSNVTVSFTANGKVSQQVMTLAPNNRCMGYCWRNTDWMLSISSDGVYNLIRISDWSIVASLATGKSLIPDGLVGGSWDAYGCNPSTGASWSKVKQTCVQWFAEPSVQLHGTMSEGTFSSSVYGMFDDNAKTKVEVKFSSYDELLSLDPASNGTKWSNSICTLTLANDIYTLSWTKDGTVITTLQGK